MTPRSRRSRCRQWFRVFFCLVASGAKARHGGVHKFDFSEDRGVLAACAPVAALYYLQG